MLKQDYTLAPTEIPDFAPERLSRADVATLKEEIKDLLRERNAVLVSHYYVDPDVQDIATETGGLRFGLA